MTSESRRATQVPRLALLVLAASFACSSAAEELVSIRTVARQPVRELNALSLGSLRVLAPPAAHAVIPYATSTSDIRQLLVPAGNSARLQELRFPIARLRVGGGCLTADGALSLPETTADGDVLFHVIRLGGPEHERTRIAFGGDAIWAGSDCRGLLVRESGASGEVLRYLDYKGEATPKAQRWRLPVASLFPGAQVEIADIVLERDRINVFAQSLAETGQRLVSVVSIGGERLENAFDPRILDHEVLSIVPTSYGYLADRRKSVFERSGSYMLLNPALSVTGSIQVDARWLPVVQIPGRTALLVPNLTEVSGRPTLELVRIGLDGKVARDTSAIANQPALKSVVFGTTILGVVHERVLGLSQGTEMTKVAGKFVLHDSLYYFPVVPR